MIEYNPEFYFNQGEVWSQDDLGYLINWYEIIGAEEMSFALGRTIKSVIQKVYQLRKEGVMKKPKNKCIAKKEKKETSSFGELTCHNNNKISNYSL